MLGLKRGREAVIGGSIAAESFAVAAPIGTERIELPVKAASAVGVAGRRLDSPTVAILLLVGAAALDHFSFQVGKLAVYPENVALGLVAAVYVLSLVLGRVRWYWPVASLPLAGWLLISLVSSAAHAPERGHSLLLWNKLLFVVATYLIAVNLARIRPLAALRAQVTVAAAACVYAVLAFISWKTAGSHWGMVHPALNVGRAWLTEGTLREPDILGSFAAAGALLSLPFAVGASHFRLARSPLPRWAAWSGFFVCTLAVIVSGSRTAWLTLSACLVVAAGLYFGPRLSRINLRFLLPFVLLAAALVTTFALREEHALLPKFQPGQNGSLVQRLASFGSLNHERDVTVREEIYRNALVHVPRHLLLGWGVGAYGESFTYPWPDLAHPGWISNLPIHVLYDSGLIGLFLFSLAVASTAWRGIASWRHHKGLEQSLLAGLLLALLALLLAFQATEATWFAYPWIFLGTLEGVLGRHQAGLTRHRGKLWFRTLWSGGVVPGDDGPVGSARGALWASAPSWLARTTISMQSDPTRLATSEATCESH